MRNKDPNPWRNNPRDPRKEPGMHCENAWRPELSHDLAKPYQSRSLAYRVKMNALKDARVPRVRHMKPFRFSMFWSLGISKALDHWAYSRLRKAGLIYWKGENIAFRQLKNPKFKDMDY